MSRNKKKKKQNRGNLKTFCSKSTQPTYYKESATQFTNTMVPMKHVTLVPMHSKGGRGGRREVGQNFNCLTA